MQIQTVDELFHTHLRTLYSIEEQLVKALPIMAESATSDALKSSLTQHLEVTKTQLKRLQDIGQDLDIQMHGTTDMGMMESLKEGQAVVQSITDPEVRDMEIMAAADKVEHYEMAAYNGGIALAKKLEMDDVSDSLNESYDEEKNAARMIEAMSSNGLMKKVAEKLA